SGKGLDARPRSPVPLKKPWRPSVLLFAPHLARDAIRHLLAILLDHRVDSGREAFGQYHIVGPRVGERVRARMLEVQAGQPSGSRSPGPDGPDCALELGDQVIVLRAPADVPGGVAADGVEGLAPNHDPAPVEGEGVPGRPVLVEPADPRWRHGR